VTRAASNARTGLLAGPSFFRDCGDALARAAAEAGLDVEPIPLAADPEARLDAERLARIEIACFSRDVLPRHGRAFFAALHGAARLRWFHFSFTGVDHPVFQPFLERGIPVTNSPGSAAEPIAQSAIGGLLMLARGFLRWGDAQRRRAWEPIRDADAPGDLRGQTMLVLGLGSIGAEIARLGRALGLHVVGVRRSLSNPGGHAHEVHPPEALPSLLPGAEWLVLACPLTDETRRVIDADALARLPRRAHLINVSRGEVVDEKALVAALAGGTLAGAYLDVFEVEPLPADSPLWGLPNVILSPHNSAVSSGNEARQVAIFLANLVRFGRGEPLEHRVDRAAARAM
jgi:phosphoglycerate dehydrogenase-like enzyme